MLRVDLSGWNAELYDLVSRNFPVLAKAAGTLLRPGLRSRRSAADDRFVLHRSSERDRVGAKL